MGVKCSLAENVAPRAYSVGQAGMGVAPYVVQIPEARYDIGLYGPDKDGGYEARTDFWSGSVEKVLGAPACSIESREQARLGKLFQTYGIHATMEAARAKGHMVRRTAGADGAVKLIVTGV